MAHYKRHKPHITKEPLAKYQEPPQEPVPSPAKLPASKSQYCKKLKGRHDFLFQHEWDYVQRDLSVVITTITFKEYRCTACSKKRIDLLEDGKPYR